MRCATRTSLEAGPKEHRESIKEWSQLCDSPILEPRYHILRRSANEKYVCVLERFEFGANQAFISCGWLLVFGGDWEGRLPPRVERGQVFGFEWDEMMDLIMSSNAMGS